MNTVARKDKPVPKKQKVMTSTSISMNIWFLEILREHAAAHNTTISKLLVDLAMIGLAALAESDEAAE